MIYKKPIPIFTKELRDEILNWTDDKAHRSIIKAFDSTNSVVILCGAKNVSKSFNFAINSIYNIVNYPNRSDVFGRNMKKDIRDTVKATLTEALEYLHFKHDLNFLKYFDIQNEIAIFKPTGQQIYFRAFDKPNAFSGFNTGSYGRYIGDVYLDEIMQLRSTFENMTDNQIDNFYKKQEQVYNTIKQSTILRHPSTDGLPRHIFISCNLWEKNHWIVKRYFDKVLPIGKQNYKPLEKKHYIFVESKKEDCTIMRFSRFYAPKEVIDENQKKEYEYYRKNDYPYYVATVLGDAFIEQNLSTIKPFKKYIYENDVIKSELFFNWNDFDVSKIELVIDGFDPGLHDKNGFVRIVLTNDLKILVLLAEEIDSKMFNNKRINVVNHILSRVLFLNQTSKIDASLLAIDSKDDVIAEIIQSQILQQDLPIKIEKAIKNKNPFFGIDFSILNRMFFIQQLFENKLIQFSPSCQKLLEYLALISLDENDFQKRNEKENAHIYDLINAFEYALSLVYKQISLLFPNIAKNLTKFQNEKLRS